MPNTHSTLTSLFSDIANAIRAKKGTSADIVADNFPSEIASIPSGGGSLPSSISKIDGGSFTVASNTDGRNYSILHNLGDKPKGYVIWSDDVVYGTAESTIMVANLLYKVCSYSATAVGSYMMTRKTTSGAFGQYVNAVATTAESSWLTASDIKIGITSTYKAGCTYKWLAWA